MTLVTATWLIFKTHLWTVTRSRRALLCLVLALGPPIVAMAPPPQVDASEVVWIVGMFFLLQLVAPLMGLIAGSAVVTEEIENRTITYVFTRPVPRVSLFLGRYLATLTLLTALLVPSALGVVAVSGLRGRAPDLEAGVAQQLVLAVVLGGGLYSLLTGGLGVFVRKPMVVGLFYLIPMEAFLANVPGSTQALTVQYYLRGIFTRLGERDVEFLREADMITGTEFLPPGQSAARLVVLMLVAVCVCAWGIRRRQYVLTS